MDFIYRGSKKVVVGITSRSSEKDLQWLMTFIRQIFRDAVSNVKYLPITNRNSLEWEEEVKRCSVGILYHTKRQGRINIVDVDGALYDDELRFLSRTLGNSKVLVVLDDLENCFDSEKQRILDSQPSLKRYSSQLLLIPEECKCEEAKKHIATFSKVIGFSATAVDNPATNTKKSKGDKESGQNHHTSTSLSRREPQNSVLPDNRLQDSWTSFVPTCKQIWERGNKMVSDLNPNFQTKVLKPRQKISMFSRSAQSNYQWLMNWLRSSCRMRDDDVRGVYITNHSTSFYSELPHCSFAILYHTQKQGRLNITDVTDSLYDEELRELSRFHGKENVIVVIDDLQNVKTTEKARVLGNQPSIGHLARDLFLFTEKEKSSENLIRIKEILRELSSATLIDNNPKLPANICPSSPAPPSSSLTYSSARSDPGTEPSASGVNHSEVSPPNRAENRRSSDYSNGAEEPALKKPFLEQEQLESSKSWDDISDMCTQVASAGHKYYQYFLALEEQIKQKQREMQRMEKTMEEQQRMITNLIQEVDSRNQIIRDKDNKIQQIGREQEQKEAEMRNLQSKMKSHEMKEEKIQREMQRMEKTMEEQQWAITSLKQEVDSRNQTIRDKDNNIHQMGREQEQKEAEMRNLQRQMDEMQQNRQRLEELSLRGNLEKSGDKVQGQMSTMGWKEANSKGRGGNSVDPAEYSSMEEDSGRNQEQRAALSGLCSDTAGSRAALSGLGSDTAGSRAALSGLGCDTAGSRAALSGLGCDTSGSSISHEAHNRRR